MATLALLTVLVQRIFGSPLRPEFRAGGPWALLWQQAVAAGWWIAAARGIAGVARLLLVQQNRSRETQSLSDLVGAAIYVATERRLSWNSLSARLPWPTSPLPASVPEKDGKSNEGQPAQGH